MFLTVIVLLQDLYVYVSENDKMPIFDRPSELVWNLPNIQYGDWYSGENMDGTFENEVEIEIPEAVQNNGSLYIHSILVRTGDSPNPSDKGHYNKKYTIHQRKKMNKFKKRRYSKTHNLLTGETTATEEEVLVSPHPTATNSRSCNLSLESGDHQGGDHLPLAPKLNHQHCL